MKKHIDCVQNLLLLNSMLRDSTDNNQSLLLNYFNELDTDEQNKVLSSVKQRALRKQARLLDQSMKGSRISMKEINHALKEAV